MYRDCDHLLNEKNIYTVRGNWSASSSLVLVKPVYEKNSETGVFEKIVDRKGVSGENLAWIDPKNFRQVSCKGIDVAEFSSNSVWDKIVHGLLDLGVSAENIGVFGSKKLNLKNCKDVDFVIYGRENMLLLKNNIAKFKADAGLYNQTVAHAKYQAEVHGRYFSGDANNLLMCLLRKWSTCALDENSTTTLRFVDDSKETGGEILELFFNQNYEPLTSMRGSVSDADNTSFMPRKFNLNCANESVEVVTPLWIFHQCVRDNDLVEVTGKKVGNKLLVREYCHGIRHL